MAYLFGSSGYPCAHIVVSESLHVGAAEDLTNLVKTMWAQETFVSRLVSIEDETTDVAVVKVRKVVEMAKFMANILSYTVVKTDRRSMPVVFGVEVGKILSSMRQGDRVFVLTTNDQLKGALGSIGHKSVHVLNVTDISDAEKDR